MLWWFGLGAWGLAGVAAIALARGNGFGKGRSLLWGLLGPAGFALAFRAASKLPRCPLDNSKVRCPDCKECATPEPHVKDNTTG